MKTIYIFWGYPLCDNCLIAMLDTYWSGWQVKWIKEGYAGFLELINNKNNNLLIPQEEAMNNVIEIFKEPIKRGLACLNEENQSSNKKLILECNNYLQDLENLKQEWFDNKK